MDHFSEKKIAVGNIVKYAGARWRVIKVASESWVTIAELDEFGVKCVPGWEDKPVSTRVSLDPKYLVLEERP